MRALTPAHHVGFLLSTSTACVRTVPALCCAPPPAHCVSPLSYTPLRTVLAVHFTFWQTEYWYVLMANRAHAIHPPAHAASVRLHGVVRRRMISVAAASHQPSFTGLLS